MSDSASFYSSAGGVEGLRAAWFDESLSLAEKARLVSRFKMKSRLTLEGAARLCDTSPARMLAMLELATLDDEDLELVSEANMPMTTWLLLAGQESRAIRAGVEAYRRLRPDEVTLGKVYEAIRKEGGPDIDERVAGISGRTLGHLASKAKQYGKLKPNARKLLVDVARRRRAGGVPTERQLAWLKAILFELVDERVVRRDSPDGDQEHCDEVLDALGL